MSKKRKNDPYSAYCPTPHPNKSRICLVKAINSAYQMCQGASNKAGYLTQGLWGS